MIPLLGAVSVVSNRDKAFQTSLAISPRLRAICLSHSETFPARVMTPMGFTKQFPIFRIAFWGYATAGLWHAPDAHQFVHFCRGDSNFSA